MPRGNPRKYKGFRLDQALVADVQALTDNFTAAVEAGLRWWLAREKRRAGKADKLAKHLTPPTGREIAARRARHG
jgi:hypothetical protein